MISTRKCTGLRVDGAQVSTHSRPSEFFSPHGSDRRGWKQGKGSVYNDGGTELLYICAKKHGSFKCPGGKGRGAVEGSGQ